MYGRTARSHDGGFYYLFKNGMDVLGQRLSVGTVENLKDEEAL
jgi:hypothetical protein